MAKETPEERKKRRQKKHDSQREEKYHLKEKWLNPEVWVNYEPVSEEEMNAKSYRYTLCEILRECYRLTGNPAIRLRLRIACSLGKSLCARITHFEGYHRWGAFQYKWNPNRKHERAKKKFEAWFESWRNQLPDDEGEENT